MRLTDEHKLNLDDIRRADAHADWGLRAIMCSRAVLGDIEVYLRWFDHCAYSFKLRIVVIRLAAW